MPKFLLQLAYNNSSWANQIQGPDDRVEAVRPVVKAVGGDIDVGYLAFGDYDLVLIVDMPDTIDAAALWMAFASNGGIKALQTTPLLTAADGIQAMQKAARA
jgi:uncharacterized protein with GYD domain